MYKISFYRLLILFILFTALQAHPQTINNMTGTNLWVTYSFPSYNPRYCVTPGRTQVKQQLGYSYFSTNLVNWKSWHGQFLQGTELTVYIDTNGGINQIAYESAQAQTPSYYVLKGFTLVIVLTLPLMVIYWLYSSRNQI